jgi:hypothetical protein
MTPIFTSWEPKHTELWGNQPLRLSHSLHEHELFSRQALARLIESYPPKAYMLVAMGAQGEEKMWREGEIGSLSGEQVIDAIAAGRMWLNLIRVNEIDRRYGALLDDIFGEIEQRVPGYATFRRINGILISSPKAQVYYHFDTSGQSLWQIAGGKRVYVYPPVPPFLTQPTLEEVTLYHNEVNIKYEKWYDEYATVMELGPGQMATWPLNCPHRIENWDQLSVSMTVEYQTKEIRRRGLMNSANGILREKFGIVASRNLAGLGYWTKTAMYGAVNKAGLLEGPRSKRRPRTFRLDPSTPGHIIDTVSP